MNPSSDKWWRREAHECSTPIYDKAAWDRGFAPLPDPSDEVTVTRGGMDRPDIRRLPLTGPQSPGEAW